MFLAALSVCYAFKKMYCFGKIAFNHMCHQFNQIDTSGLQIKSFKIRTPKAVKLIMLVLLHSPLLGVYVVL